VLRLYHEYSQIRSVDAFATPLGRTVVGIVTDAPVALEFGMQNASDSCTRACRRVEKSDVLSFWAGEGWTVCNPL